MSLFKVSHYVVVICLPSLPSFPVPTPAISILPSPVVPIGSNVTLTCNIQLDPSVDSTVMVNSTWIGPGGKLYNGTASKKNGSPYQNILTLVSLKVSDVGVYNCSVPVTPATSQYITMTTGSTAIQGILMARHRWVWLTLLLPQYQLS